MDRDRLVLAGILVGVGIPLALMAMLANGFFENPFD